jgi:hypothetical protein
MKREYSESTSKKYFVVVHFDKNDGFVNFSAYEKGAIAIGYSFADAKLCSTLADAIGLRNLLDPYIKEIASIEFLDFQKRRIVKHKL